MSYNITNTELLIEYENQLIIEKLSKKTKEPYLKTASEIVNYYENLENINNKNVYDFIKDIKNMSNNSRNAKFASMRKFLKYLVNEGFENCKIRILNIKVDRKIPKYLSIENTKDLINKLKKEIRKNEYSWRTRRDYAIVMILYACGLRVSELLNLQLENFEESWIRIEAGKGNKDRYIPIEKKALKAFQDYYKYLPEQLKKQKELFFNNKMEKYKVHGIWYLMKNKYGINPHMLRHSFASHLIMGNCDISIVSDFLGHANMSTTTIYTHIEKNELKKTVMENHPMSKDFIKAT